MIEKLTNRILGGSRGSQGAAYIGLGAVEIMAAEIQPPEGVQKAGAALVGAGDGASNQVKALGELSFIRCLLAGIAVGQVIHIGGCSIPQRVRGEHADDGGFIELMGAVTAPCGAIKIRHWCQNSLVEVAA